MSNRNVIAQLAPAFNMLLGIGAMHFGSSPKNTEPGNGTKRRMLREANQRKREAARTKDAEPARYTRQQRRRELIIRAKAERQKNKAMNLK